MSGAEVRSSCALRRVGKGVSCSFRHCPQAAEAEAGSMEWHMAQAGVKEPAKVANYFQEDEFETFEEILAVSRSDLSTFCEKRGMKLKSTNALLNYCDRHRPGGQVAPPPVRAWSRKVCPQDCNASPPHRRMALSLPHPCS